MAVLPRTLKRGDIQLVWATVVDVTGADISADVYQVAHILDSQKNDDQASYPWEAPHALSNSPTLSTRRVAKLVTAALVGDIKTKYRVFVKVADTPEIVAIDCGTYTVVP